MLHCAMAKNVLRRQPLRKVEPDSTSCNASCNDLKIAEACYTVQFSLQLVSEQNCETSSIV